MIIGATSALAHEAAKHFAADGAELYLVGRSAAKLETIAGDLKVRGAKRVEQCVIDLTDISAQQAMFDGGVAALGGLDTLFVAYGTLGDQQASQASVDVTLTEMNTNFVSVVTLLTHAANYFETKKSGTIAVISSVAGDRGRMSNYVYGSAKAGLSAFLQGLRSRLFKSGVAVVTIKPGQVDTPMTAHMKKGLLFSEAAPVGNAIYRAIMKKTDVLYTPFFWWFVMLIIRNVPEFIFKRTKL
jgi:short-subunit dehydrogenase